MFCLVNGTVHFYKCKQLCEYQHLLLLKTFYGSNFCCIIISLPQLVISTLDKHLQARLELTSVEPLT
jgi:hypothetical protein